MGLNNTPLSERIHIGIFGRRNAGKSSVINHVVFIGGTQHLLGKMQVIGKALINEVFLGGFPRQLKCKLEPLNQTVSVASVRG